MESPRSGGVAEEKFCQLLPIDICGKYSAPTYHKSMEYTQNEGIESLIFLEKTFEEEGRAEGYIEGLKQGDIDGLALGIQKGFQFGKEIGYYQEFAQSWLKKVSCDPLEYPSRLLKQLEIFHSLAHSFHARNAENDDPVSLRDKLRGKYRGLISLLKVTDRYQYQTTSADQTF